ncbi:MAG: PorV/PorQ family protein [Candidatus Zixiibacteriota bacterium]
MRRFVFILLVCGSLVVAGAGAFAQEVKSINDNAGTSGFAFLKIPVGARSVAMGTAFTGLADDEFAMYYNPAGLATAIERRYVLEYHNYISDMQSGLVGMVKPLNDKNVIGGYLSYLNYGTFQRTDLTGTVLDEFSGGDIVLALSYANRPSYRFMTGGSLKLIYEKLAGYTATGVAVDIGARYIDIREKYAFGLTLQNLGTQLSSLGGEKDKLPLTLRSGAFGKPRGIYTIFSGDVVVPFDNDLYFCLGVELQKFKPLYLRAGYNSAGKNIRASGSTDSQAGFSAGVGFDHRRLHFSYAFTPQAELGDSHRLTITGAFGR